jgi:tetratricopeptide (TPR) repeat protein
LLHRAVAERPDDLEAHRLLAVVCLDLNTVDEAIHELREVGRLDPADGRPYRQIGLLLRNQRQHGPAMEAYQDALRRNLKPHVVAEVVEELAEAQIDSGLAREALATLNRCPEAFQKRPELLALRAAALWQADAQEHRADVIRLLDQALAAAPGLVPALRLRARVHIAEEEMSQARPPLLRALQNSPHDHESRHLLAQVLTSLGEGKEAAEQRRLGEASQRLKRQMDDLVRQAGAEPLADEPRLRAARICLELGEIQLAQLWLRAALACNPSNREAQKLLDELVTNPRPRS